MSSQTFKFDQGTMVFPVNKATKRGSQEIEKFLGSENIEIQKS